jgi:hypothetical protein
MPTLKRPEFLALTLEKLSLTPEAEHMDVRICADTCTDERFQEITYVRDVYLPTAEIFRAGPHVNVLSGTWNILNSLKMGYETGAEFIFFIEEDVLVKPEFFRRHWEMHDSGDYFVTCGRRYRRMPIDFYSNPGTCYRREALGLVLPHICEEYFRVPGSYLDRVFPSMRGMDGPLDDGLIRKVQRSVNGKVLCAVPAVAVHQGFHYYNLVDEFMNRGKDIREKIEILRAMLPTIDPRGRYTSDFEVFPEG